MPLLDKHKFLWYSILEFTANICRDMGLYYGPKPHLITAKKQLMRWSFSHEDDGNKKGEKKQ